MAAARKVVELSIEPTDQAELEAIARSRSYPASWVERARMLLRYQQEPSYYAVGKAVGVTHQTVQRCVARARKFGVMAALDDSPRPGKEPEITVEARAWVVSLACQKAKELGYPHELWRPPGCWRATPASMVRPPGMRAWHGSHRARCARCSPSRT
jgi:transposase